MFLWLANKVPINFAFPTGDLISSRPKIGATYKVNLLENLHWDIKRRKMINGDGSEDSFDKNNPASSSDMSSLPGRELASNLILKVLKVVLSCQIESERSGYFIGKDVRIAGRLGIMSSRFM